MNADHGWHICNLFNGVFMKKILLLAAALAVSLPAAASASVTLTSVPGSASYTGPFTYDFETPGTTPVFTNGSVLTSSSGIGARPYGTTGNFYSTGPGAGSPGTIDLSSFGDIDFISFVWGSIDTYNTLEVLDALGNVLVGGTFTGSSVIAMADGDQTDPDTNRLVTLTFTDSDRSAVSKLRLTSSGNAFEVDNFRIGAVPEPTTWMLMLMGMAGIGFSMRRKRDTKLRVRFA